MISTAEFVSLVSTAAGAPLVIAAVREMPENIPLSPQAIWSWIRATALQYLSMKGVDRPTQPESPAEEK